MSVSDSQLSIVDHVKRHLADVHESPATPLDESLLDKLDLPSCGVYMPFFHLRLLRLCLQKFMLEKYLPQFSLSMSFSGNVTYIM